MYVVWQKKLFKIVNIHVLGQSTAFVSFFFFSFSFTFELHHAMLPIILEAYLCH